MRVLSIMSGVLAWCLCIEQHTTSKVRLICSLDITIFFHAVIMSWTQKEQPTLQVDAGLSCRSSSLSECCILL